jgi:3-oxoacyl-[acyl-carrier protein] reductase
MTDKLSEQQIGELLGRIPLGSLGSPADVAGAARFLVGPGARYITGQVLAVDGGMAM